jgi:hypothetical protein
LSTVDFILARSSDDDWIKVVFGVIVAIIWGIGALVAAVNKKAQEAKRRRQYNRLPSDVARRQQPTSPRAMGAGFPPQPAPKAAKPRAKRRPVVVAQPPVPVAPVYAAPPPISQAAPPAAISQSTRRASAAAAAPSASRIGRLIRRPESLRAALILNEILAPPPGLRPGHDIGRDV